MVKSKMMVLNRREKTDTNESCSLLLKHWWIRTREKIKVPQVRVRYTHTITQTC
jgi:hypothetical protein